MIARVLLLLSLGLDTLAVAIGLGISGLPRERHLKVGLTFASFEVAMPVVGLLAGNHLTQEFGTAASYVAGALLIIIGAIAIREARSENDEEGVEGDGGTGMLDSARSLILAGLSVSMDELAVGFSLGVLRIPLGPALVYIFVQTFAATFVGLRAGRRIGARFAERAELASGVVLALLGIGVVVQQWIGHGG